MAEPTEYEIQQFIDNLLANAPAGTPVGAPPAGAGYDTQPEFYISDAQANEFLPGSVPVAAPAPAAPVVAPAPIVTRAEYEKNRRDAQIADVLSGYGGLDEALAGLSTTPEELLGADTTGRQAAQVDAIRSFQSPEYPTPQMPNMGALDAAAGIGGMPAAAPMPMGGAPMPSPQMPDMGALDAAYAAQPPAAAYPALASQGAPVAPTDPLSQAMAGITSGVGAPMQQPGLGSAISPESEAVRLANEAAPVNLAPQSPQPIDFNALIARLNSVGQ